MRPRYDQQSHDSSSSDQIILRPFGPGTNYQTPSPNVQRRNQSNVGAINPKRPDNFPPNQIIPVYQPNVTKPSQQSGYRKIPKQESDYWGHTDFNLNQNKPTQQQVRPLRELPQGGVVGLSNTNNAPRMQTNYKPASSPREENVHRFQDLNTKSPQVLKTAIDRVDNKRRSHSDDSLDELIESNIQYLESEIESGKLKKMSSTQPAAFPTKASQNQNQPDFGRGERSRTPPLSSSDFQNEVRLRLQPSMRPFYGKQEHRDNSLSSYDNKLSSYDNKTQIPSHYDGMSMTSPYGSMSPTSAQNIKNQFYSEQSNVPKVENRNEQYTHGQFPIQHELNRVNNITNSQRRMNDNGMHGSQIQPPTMSENRQINVQNLQNQEIPQHSVPHGPEQGMFSDVDYDIEVAERVKKWEKYMKHKPPQDESDKDALSLTTILEGEGGIPDNWFQDVVNDASHLTGPQNSVSSISVTVKKSTAHIHPKKTPPPLTLPVVPHLRPQIDQTTSTDQYVKLVKEPMSTSVKNPRVNTSQHSSITQTKSYKMHPDHNINSTYVSSTEPFTLNIKQDPMSQSLNLSDLQHKSRSDRQRLTKSQYFPDDRDRTPGGVLTEDHDGNIPVNLAKQSWPPRRKKHMTEEQKQARLSKYDEELTELQTLKQDNVKDLKRRFDSEASGNESTDVTDDVRSANRTPLVQRRKFFPKTTHSAPPEPVTPDERVVMFVNRSNSCQEENETERSQRLQEQEVWSPKLESTKGLVSMERVQARTLQTIPFSEDPFWRQIENMTTFDEFLKAADSLEVLQQERPSESVAFIKRNSADDSSYLSEGHQSSSSLLTSPRAAAPFTHRSFTTPVIQPLKLNIAQEKSSATALDEVLEDIRSSLDNKPDMHINPNNIHTDGRYHTGPAGALPAACRSESAPANKPISSLSRAGAQQHVQSYIQHSQPVKQNVPGYAQGVLSPQVRRAAELNNQFNMAKSPDLSSPEFTQQHQQDRLLLQQKQEQYLLQQQHMQQYLEQQAALQQQQQHHNQPQFIPEYNIEPYIVNGNYQLDPSLLKEALLDTGLAEFSDIESVVGGFNMRGPLSPAGAVGTRGPLSPIGDVSGRGPLSPDGVVYKTGPLPPVCKASDPEREVNETVDQLKNLARDVEIRLSQIRDKMDNTDENRLDSILTALRKVTPTTQYSHELPASQTVKLTSEFATDRKSKLKETLSELDKIYVNLNLDTDVPDHVPVHGNTIPRQYKTSSETNVFIRPQIKKRTKSDSEYTVSSHIEPESLAEIEKQTQKEFEDITRAFQNLLAEVDSDKNDSVPLSPAHTSKVGHINRGLFIDGVYCSQLIINCV